MYPLKHLTSDFSGDVWKCPSSVIPMSHVRKHTQETWNFLSSQWCMFAHVLVEDTFTTNTSGNTGDGSWEHRRPIQLQPKLGYCVSTCVSLHSVVAISCTVLHMCLYIHVYIFVTMCLSIVRRAHVVEMQGWWRAENRNVDSRKTQRRRCQVSLESDDPKEQAGSRLQRRGYELRKLA